jgi:(R,R)-butanediol dehydrogenase/meso-butanediol dehydrogenase/diacetyl reductase
MRRGAEDVGSGDRVLEDKGAASVVVAGLGIDGSSQVFVSCQGTCVNVAIWSIKPEIDMNTLLLGERTLKGWPWTSMTLHDNCADAAANYVQLGVICYKNNHKPALEALEAGRIKLDGFVTGKSSLKDVLKNGFQELIENNESHVKILVSPTGQ